MCFKNHEKQKGITNCFSFRGEKYLGYNAGCCKSRRGEEHLNIAEIQQLFINWKIFGKGEQEEAHKWRNIYSKKEIKD